MRYDVARSFSRFPIRSGFSALLICSRFERREVEPARATDQMNIFEPLIDRIDQWKGKSCSRLRSLADVNKAVAKGDDGSRSDTTRPIV